MVVKNGDRVRNFILSYTQFYDTSTIREDELLKAVNKEFRTSYQLNLFRSFYIDKMSDHFKKFRGEDGYYIFERIDIQPDPDWTLSLGLEFEERAKEQKWYSENENFLMYLDYARRHNDLEFKDHILLEKLAELEKKEVKATS